jgi:hypothetical protein
MWTLLKARLVRGSRIGRLWRIDVEEIRAFLERTKAGA